MAWGTFVQRLFGNKGSAVQAKDRLQVVVMYDRLGLSAEQLEALRKEPATARIPFIFMTGVPDEADLHRAYESGAAEYLVKPIPTSDLVAAINAHIGKHQNVSPG